MYAGSNKLYLNFFSTLGYTYCHLLILCLEENSEEAEEPKEKISKKSTLNMDYMGKTFFRIQSFYVSLISVHAS